MKRADLFLAFLVSLCLTASHSSAQPWAGIVDPSRAIDWSQAGVPGGVPNRTTQCSSIAAYTGTAATINTAIANCASGGYVSLGAGTFTLSTGITLKSGVTLRGQGANATFISFASGTTGAACGYTAAVCIGSTALPSPGDEKNVCNWTAGYARGSTTISIGNCGSATPAKGAIGNLQVGGMIILDQVDEANDTGTVWNCLAGVAEGGTQCANNGTGNGGGARNNGGSVGGVSARSQQQIVVVTSCDGTSTAGHVCTSGTNMTISPGLYMPNWRSTQLPQAWYSNTSTQLSGAGVENISFDFTNFGDRALELNSCYGCWIKGVRSMNSGRDHVMIAATSHDTVQDSYFYQSQSHATVSYTIESFWGVGDTLIQNNISQQVTDSMPNCNGGCEGNVHAYNFAIDDIYTTAGWMQGSFYQHASGSAFTLWEGNIGPGYTADDVHGTHHFDTLFRNYLVGNQPAGCGSAGLNTCTKQTVPVNLYAGSRYFNVVGNVLGQSGYHSTYSCVATSSASCPNGGAVTGYDKVIYEIGYTGNGGQQASAVNGFCGQPGCSSHGAFDPQVGAYLMRWGNWDVVTNGTRWCGNSSDTGWSTTCSGTSEVPAGLPSYANAVPSTETLPTSFYNASKPNWWPSASPWPPIGPDITSGTIAGVAGHANMNPAMACYLNVMAGPADGTGSVLSFNASSCYGSSGGSGGGGTTPAAQTNVTYVIQ